MKNRFAPQAARRLCCVALAAALAGCAGTMQTGTADIGRLETVAQKSGSPNDLTQLGMAYYQAQRFDDAKRVLQQAMQAGSKDGNTSLYLGLANEELGDYTAARAAYEQYVATSTGSSKVRRNIQARIPLVARMELKQQAKVAIQQEQQLAVQPPTPQSIAVLPFRLVGVSDDMEPLRTAMAEMIVTDLGFTSLRSIERVRVQSMLDEMALAAGGVTSEETGARMGRLLRAERVVQGQLTSSGGEQLSADAVVLNTVERTPGDPVTRQGQLATVFDLEKQLVFGILDAAKYPLTAAERDRINQNRAGNLLAFLAYGRGLEAMDRGDYDQATAQFRQASQLDPSFSAARVQASETTQLNNAAQTTTSEIAVLSTPNVGGGLQQSIASDLNPSPAQTIVSQTTDNNGQTQVTTTATERTAPSTEATQSPQIAQAKKATVVITVRNPTSGALHQIVLPMIHNGGK